MRRATTALAATALTSVACVGDDDLEAEADRRAATVCLSPGVYSPYAAAGSYPSGTVDELPWRGIYRGGDGHAYPAGLEDFRGYGPTLPVTVECASAKGRRDHVDVTAGCLRAVRTGDGQYKRGQVDATSDGYFRALALGYLEGDDQVVKWTDQTVDYRFHHDGRTGASGNPGFKAFVRYRSEDDLYVASWRFDGVVQIQRKLCGEYTTLAMRVRAAPARGEWHRLRFEAIGDRLRLFLDGDLVLSATSETFSWGTAGIRIDSADGALIDDWRVY